MYHCRKWLSDYHLSFAEIETTDLDFLLSLEVIDSKIEFAFEQQRRATHNWQSGQVFIDQIL